MLKGDPPMLHQYNAVGLGMSCWRVCLLSVVEEG